MTSGNRLERFAPDHTAEFHGVRQNVQGQVRRLRQLAPDVRDLRPIHGLERQLDAVDLQHHQAPVGRFGLLKLGAVFGRNGGRLGHIPGV